MKFDTHEIRDMIYYVRGYAVMFDSDLAKLYEVETSALNRQVKRNPDRFPKDFTFQISKDEYKSLICQNGIPNEGRGGRRNQPFVFTEVGVAMLSSVLKSDKAAMINISIMRTFVKLRSFHALEDRIDRKVNDLEENVTKVFKVVFERLDSLGGSPEKIKKKSKIGFKKN
ncbi:hypothetical protein A9Q84_18205 [Halobacteriovorax marinus]|uniref:KilA-N DNA-binding domain-containing protein n=1 Tax=Halobacteriovorax marinus TaxID=97084 RepID=A0A1Y5F2Y4_9BACT|nr:hypothetical protein A9Q84_18205 [Halobacteriovorax marinus]